MTAGAPNARVTSNARGLLRWLWIAIAIQLAGRLVDLRWHLANDEFEGTSQQFEAHWLLWIGVIGTLAVAFVGWRNPPSGLSRSGLLAIVLTAIAYSGVSVWHFIEHANGADPELAHLLLALTQTAMLVAAIWLTVRARALRVAAS